MKNICEGVFNSFYIKSKIIQKITFEFTLYISDFFNTARESGKSYMINHVVYFGFNKDLNEWSPAKWLKHFFQIVQQLPNFEDSSFSSFFKQVSGHVRTEALYAIFL